MKPLLEVRELRKHFALPHGRVLRAVDGISLDIGEREVLGLVGESGCGKSTFGRTVVGLHDRTSGEVAYRGEMLPGRFRPADFRRWGRNLQMIFQDPYSSLNPRMTLREIVAEGPLLHGMWPRREVPARVGAWLKRVGLSPDQMSRYPHEFSGGQRQRIGIARALAVEPELVVCDEPISALDVSVQAQVVNLLADLKETMGLTLLFILTNLGLGLLISTVVDNQQQAMMGAVFGGMVPMIYLSGLMFPIENMPRAIQLVTYLIPLRYYAEIIRGVFLRGSGLGVLWPEAAALLGMGVTILAVASFRFRKRLD